MAKGKSTISAIAQVDAPFSHPDEINWASLEEEIGISFSENDRHEIFLCGYVGIMHRNAARDGAPSKDVIQLRDRILGHIDGLLGILSITFAENGTVRDEDVMSQLHAISLSVPDPTFNLASELTELAPLAAKIQRALQVAAVEEASTSKDPNVVGLAHFIAECVKGADARPARASPGYLHSPAAFEHRRWGIALSAKSGPLPQLASASMDRKVSEGQVKNAFAVAKELGLLQ